MKKLLLLLTLSTICLTSAAQSSSFNYTYNKEKITVDGIDYLLVYTKHNTSQTGYDVELVNLTKDKLEIDLLKKQIEELDRIKKLRLEEERIAAEKKAKKLQPKKK
jgi:hypothetical protein